MRPWRINRLKSLHAGRNEVVSLSEDEIRVQELKKEDRRQNIAFGVAATVGILGLVLGFIAAMSHGVPRWLVIAAFFLVGIFVVPAVGFAWVAIFSRVCGWAVKKPLASLKATVQKDDVVSLFTIIISPIQALIFFVSGEIIVDEYKKIAVGLIVGTLSISGGIFATLAKNKRMYFCGAGAVVLSLIPIVLAAYHYQRWIGGFGALGIFDQTVIIGAFVASVLLLVLVVISWPLVRKPKKEDQIEPDTSNPATAPAG